MSSSVPPIEFTLAGIVLPEETAILAAVQTDIDAAFGGGVNPALETPQGQIASTTAAVIADKNAEIAYIVNQVDPQYADGRFQDAIGRIYFLTRKPATPTTVDATLIGLEGVVIPAGTLAQDQAGNFYTCSANVTIPAGGSIDAEFQAVETGPIACAAGALNVVYQSIPGWDAITNAAAGVLGSNVESRSGFEFRRKNSVFLNANGSPGAIYAAVFNVPDVVDCYVIDNPSGAPQNVGATNYPMLPHSVYVAAVGGTDAAVAAAIWSKKDVGCNMNGNTSVVVYDTSGYADPKPSYTIKFERPDAVAVKFAVRIVSQTTNPANVVDLVKASIIARFTGSDGTARERIGSTIYASRYYGAIISAVPSISIVDIYVGTVTANQPSVLIGVDQVPAIDSADISVTFV